MMLYKIEAWLFIMVMLTLAIVSIKAYRTSLKKVFILFMVISIPTSAMKIYTQINSLTLRKFHNTIPYIIGGKDLRERAKISSNSPEYIEYDMKQREIWLDSFRKQRELENEYADAIAEYRKSRSLNTIWVHIRGRFAMWLFPIVAIIVCRNEIKSSNQRFQAVATAPGSPVSF